MHIVHFGPITNGTLVAMLALMVAAYANSSIYERVVWLPRCILLLLLIGFCAWNAYLPLLVEHVMSATDTVQSRVLPNLLPRVPIQEFLAVVTLLVWAETLNVVAGWRVQISKSSDDPTRIA